MSDVAAEPAPRPRRVEQLPRRWPVAVGSFVVGLVALAAVMALTGGVGPTYPGLPDAGPVTGVLLPVARYSGYVLGALTVGFLVLAVGLLPVRGKILSGSSHRALRTASAVAAVWAVVAVVTALLTLSDILGQPLSETLRPEVLRAFLFEFPQSAGFLYVAFGAGVLAVACYFTLTSSFAVVLLGFSVLVLVPPALTGHASAAANHDLATSGALLHTFGVEVWVGGLAALMWFGLGRGRRLAPGPLGFAAARFSSLALWCFGIVALGGVVSAAVRLVSVTDLFTTTYGRVLMLKVALLVVLGVLGARHRRRTLPAVAEGSRGAFVRLASVELAVMAAAMGVAVALARTAPPVPDDARVYPDLATGLLGYELEPSPTLWELVTTWRIEPLITVVLIMAAVAYGTGVRRLARRGVRWPVGRTISWATGLALLFLSTSSGFAAYSPAMFSVHMIQHMTMSMFAPLALALAAPITLALRALPSATVRSKAAAASGIGGPATEPDVRGPREWLLVGLNSPVTRVLTHPLVAFVLFVSATYLVYFTGLFQVALRNHWAHLAMFGHFVLVGLLFAYVVVGVDPGPHRLPFWQRILLLFATTPFHAFFGVIILSSGTLIAADWYLGLGWGTAADLLADQQLGGGIAWAVGEIVVLVVVTALFVQWSRSDEREARRLDRAADRAQARTATLRAAGGGGTEQEVGAGAGDPSLVAEDDALARYNAYLARLSAAEELSRSSRGTQKRE